MICRSGSQILSMSAFFGVTGMFGYHAPEALEYLAHCLVKLVFASVTPKDFG